jgi:hypothetical protein
VLPHRYPCPTSGTYGLRKQFRLRIASAEEVARRRVEIEPALKPIKLAHDSPTEKAEDTQREPKPQFTPFQLQSLRNFSDMRIRRIFRVLPPALGRREVPIGAGAAGMALAAEAIVPAHAQSAAGKLDHALHISPVSH